MSAAGSSMRAAWLAHAASVFAASSAGLASANGFFQSFTRRST
jgi:hypothetical protein